MKKYRVIVAHAGQQTSFRRAEALKKGDMLHKYITTVYLKKEKMASLGLLKKIARKEYDRLILRNCPSLDDTEVVQYDVIQNLILIAINRVAKLKKLYINLNLYLSKKFAKKVASYAKKENVDALIMMGAAPAAAFDDLRDTKIIKIFDMTSIAYNYQSMIMQEMLLKMPIEWRKYISTSSDENTISELMKNIISADHIICSSDFAKQSLIANEIPQDRIHVIRYGLEQNQKEHIKRNSSKLELLYIGSVSCEKGIYFLLEAIKKINSYEISLTLVGKKYIDDELLEPYKRWCSFVGDIPHAQVKQYYCCSDIFILPTLFDSFGRVISEAMSYGLPVIGTDHAGAADYIDNGVNGFVISAGDIDSIADSILYFMNDRNEVKRMGSNAAKTTQIHTWVYYEKEYVETIKRIIENEAKDKSSLFD